MASEIEPVGTEEFNGDLIREYDLPTGEDPPLLWIDTFSDGYSAEWLVDFDADGFERFLRQEMQPDHNFAVATIEPEAGEGYKIYGAFAYVLEKDDYHADDCTYLQVRTDDFDLGWEDWGEDQRLILTVENTDGEPLERFLHSSLEQSESIPDAYSAVSMSAVSQAEEVIKRDYRREG